MSADVLYECIQGVKTVDPSYAFCLENSGLFETLDGGLLGTCKLLCTSFISQPSASCCEASTKAINCTPSNNKLPVCKNLLRSMVNITGQCGLDNGTRVFFIGCLFVLILLLLLIIISQIYTRRKRSLLNANGEDTNAIEERLEALAENKWTSIFSSWRQVSNLVWKNFILRRRRPVAVIFEQLLPIILVTALVFLANLENIFGNSSNEIEEENNQASTTTGSLICTGIQTINEEYLGAPSDTMKNFYSAGQTVIGIFLLISFVKFVSTTTTTMVLEKENRAREIMKIMGLTDITMLASWVITGAAVTTPLSFLISAELKFGGVFPMASYGTLVFFFWSFSMAITGFSYFLTPFFNKSRTASITSVLIWIILYFPFYSVQPKSNFIKYLAALLPPTAFALGVDDLLQHASIGTGMMYAVTEAQLPISVPSVFRMSLMLLLDTVWCFALGWYFEQIIPQEFGVHKKWNFIFQKGYWKPSDMHNQNNDTDMTTCDVGQIRETDTTDRATISPANVNYMRMASSSLVPSRTRSQLDISERVESVNATLQDQERRGTCLQLKKLHKQFGGKSVGNGEDDAKIAVNQLSLNFYSGQITALLGHNGAGKTTTISMLTGLIRPSAGDAVLYNRSIRSKMDDLRLLMGICPQHDVLFPTLTVQEHLLLYGTMKKVAVSDLKKHVSELIEEVGLTEKQHVRSNELSGGQKRKLSVAIAFLGDSKLVFLDEPTSGMDPYSRRFTWNLLQKRREGRIIILTTHFMDEADILGDRIAIMSNGNLCCAGSSLYLKQKYGTGYNLTIVTAPHCNIDNVTKFLRRFIPNTNVMSHFGSELVYQLPSSESAAFSSLLKTLDYQMPYLGLIEYGISVTTLEEVFLQIARSNDEHSPANQGFNSEQPDPSGRNSLVSITSRKVQPKFGQQLFGLVIKRFQITRRDRKAWGTAIAIPLLFLFMLVFLPTIEVSNFLPGHTTKFISTEDQADCKASNFTTVEWFDTLAQFSCNTQTFDYCRLGIIDCNPDECCNKQNSVSPYYPCNLCVRPKSQVPCFNSKCLEKDSAKLQITLNAFLLSIVVMIAFAFIPAAIISFIVKEKNEIQNAKLLQLICGTRVGAYWVSNFIHDVVLCLVPVLAATLLVPLTSKTIQEREETLATAFLVMAHCLAVIPLAYCYSFRFSNHAAAQTSILVFALSTGGLLSIFSFMCRVINFDLFPNSESNLSLGVLDRNYLRWIFLIFPGYSLNVGVYEIATRKLSRSAVYYNEDTIDSTFFGAWKGLGSSSFGCPSCWDNPGNPNCCYRDVFDLDVSSASIIVSLVEALIFIVWLFFIEKQAASWSSTSVRYEPSRSNSSEDSDVTAERFRVSGRLPDPNVDQIFIQHLRHVYSGVGYKGNKKKVALRDLCLSIPKGQCFGYLGINGAGKSTTMKILTGQLAPSRGGNVFLGGYDLSKHISKARQIIGYCPQFDSLHDLLTVSEQLTLFARLKGIKSRHIKATVEEQMTALGLLQYRNKLTKGLSGGNKRKVSTAIALMGAPSIVFLDEPSTGVDPAARRQMWNVISSVCTTHNSSVVLTTHSMEECQALCSRVGILVSGELKCLGSVEHLKQKFSSGYTVEIHLKDPNPSNVSEFYARVRRFLASTSSAPVNLSRRAYYNRQLSRRYSRRFANGLNSSSTNEESVLQITSENVTSLCSKLGMADRGQMILEGIGSGSILKRHLDNQSEPIIPINLFCNWWVAENIGDELQRFMTGTFPGCQLVEHQSTNHFRFQIPKKSDSIRPYTIFDALERGKDFYHIEDYGVNDTTLEHIFNNMAAQQEEEKLHRHLSNSAVIGGSSYQEQSYSNSQQFSHQNSNSYNYEPNLQSIRSYRQQW